MGWSNFTCHCVLSLNVWNFERQRVSLSFLGGPAAVDIRSARRSLDRLHSRAPDAFAARSKTSSDLRKTTSMINVYCYPQPLVESDTLSDGSESAPFRISSPTMYFWVDLMPEARFAHPTLHVLLSETHSRLEQGEWWPVLNGRVILYGDQNPTLVKFPFSIPSALTRGLNLNVPSAGNVPTTGSGLLPDRGQGGGAPDGFGHLPDASRFVAARPSGTHVFTVEQVSYSVIKTLPPKLQVSAIGFCRTTGWSNPRLVPRVYVVPPADGIWEFDFRADPPVGIVLNLLTPIAASVIYEGDFQNWKGIRVISESNSREIKFGETAGSRIEVPK